MEITTPKTKIQKFHKIGICKTYALAHGFLGVFSGNSMILPFKSHQKALEGWQNLRVRCRASRKVANGPTFQSTKGSVSLILQKRCKNVTFRTHFGVEITSPKCKSVKFHKMGICKTYALANGFLGVFSGNSMILPFKRHQKALEGWQNLRVRCRASRKVANGPTF